VYNPINLIWKEHYMSEVATFGAGCFWGVEANFRRIPGVIEAISGYAGGQKENPTYREVCTDTTGHAEVVQVTFDPAKVSYEQLLDAFWKMHDPTQVNRQGPDFGRQYRTAIFFHSPEQEAVARKSKQAVGASGRFRHPIATEITPAGPFWPAEEYHQRYLEKRGATNCHL
jgi:peptide-methionine (S)-S-oxide reductase